MHRSIRALIATQIQLMDTRPRTTAAERAREKLSRACTTLQQAHAMSAPHAYAMLCGIGDFSASYEVVPLPLTSAVAFIRTGDPRAVVQGHIAARGTPAHSQRRVANSLDDYLYRPGRFSGLGLWDYLSATTVTGLRTDVHDDAPRQYYRFRAGHPMGHRTAVVVRRKPACPLVLGHIPPHDSVDEAWVVLALFLPFRPGWSLGDRMPGDVAAELLRCDPRARELWSNITILRDCPFEPLPMEMDEAEVPRGPARAATEATVTGEHLLAAQAAARMERPDGPLPRVPDAARPPDDRHMPPDSGAPIMPSDGGGTRQDPCIGVDEPTPEAIQAAVRSGIDACCSDGNDEQRRVVQLLVESIVGHLGRRVLVLGGPGTGKTTLVRAVMHAMDQLRRAHRVALLAYSGRAVVHLMGIRGRTGTTSSFLGVDSYRRNRLVAGRPAEVVDARLTDIDGVVIDEISMCGCAHLRAVEERLRRARPCAPPNECRAFGSFTVAFVGDPNQHKPILDTPIYAGWAHGSVSGADARMLLRDFEHVFVLRAVHRTLLDAGGRRLAEWQERVRTGCATREDIVALASRHLGAPGMPLNLDDPLLRRSTVITLRNRTRLAIEFDHMRRWAHAAGERLVTWLAEEWSAGAAGASRDFNRLPARGYFFRGMRAAIADRISPEACLVRNNDALLTDIVFGREVPDTGSEVLELDFVPAGVYARPAGCEGQWVPGRPPGEVYLTPIICQGGGVRRRNLPYSSLACTTDYFAEGATVTPPDRVVLDLRRPERGDGQMSRASVIVATSRMRSWDEVFLYLPLWSEETEEENIQFFLKLLLPPIDLAMFLYDMEERAGLCHARSRADHMTFLLERHREAERALRAARRVRIATNAPAPPAAGAPQ